MESLFTAMTINLAVVCGFMVLGWIASLAMRNVTLVDSLWGLGFVVIAWITIGLSSGNGFRPYLIAILVTLWGLRLSAHLTLRNWGKGEDPRYGAWRAESGNRFWLVSLFKVFLLQAVVLWLISISFQYGQLSQGPESLSWFEGIGVMLWLVGFLFEAVGDWQLANFKRDPTNKGKIMDQGLWAYSRHPNYFGDSLVWWGLYVITLATPGGWATIFSPVLITLVLVKMTGVALTEKYIQSRRPGYQRYMQRTSTFLPWFPKRG